MSKEQNTRGIERRRFRPYPQYKDSGVEWLGKIPANWEARRLKYLSRIIMGQSPPSDIVNTSGEGLPFLQGNADFGTEHPIARTFCPYPPKVAAPEDILISVRAPVGAINSADREYGIGRGLCAIRPFIRQLERRFCSYLLQIARSQLDSIATGSTYDAVSANDVSCLMLYLPSIEEQHRISYFLDCETAKLDASIEKKERLIELLQEKRTAIITQAVTKGLNPTVPMKDSGIEWLGKIPVHWGAFRVKSFTKEHKQGFYTEQPYIDEGVKLARISDIDDRANVHFNNMPYVGIDAKDECIFRLSEGDILFARSGTIGRYGIVCGTERAVFASYLIRFRFSRVHVEFLRFAFGSKYFRDSLVSSLHGGANQNVHAENIKALTIALPPHDEQLKITAYLFRETAKVDTLVAEIQDAIDHLRDYRTALIAAAVTGKIDLRK